MTPSAWPIASRMSTCSAHSAEIADAIRDQMHRARAATGDSGNGSSEPVGEV